MTGRWILFVTLAALLLASAVPATANEAPGDRGGTTGAPGDSFHLSLDDAIARAQDSSPDLLALAGSTEAAEHEAAAARRRRWGDLDAVASYQLHSDDVIVRPISRQLLSGGFANLPFDDQQWHYGVTAEVPLYLGGKLAGSIKIAELSEETARALLTGTRWQVRFNVTSLYVTAQSLDAVDDALGHQLAALETTASHLDLMVSVGKAPELDRLKVEEELQGVRARRAAVRADRRKVGALLLSLIGQDPATRVEVDPLPESEPRLAASATELRGGLEAASTVRRAQIALEQADAGIKVARSELIPKVVASGSYLVNEGRSLEHSYDTWSISMGLTVPLFDGGSRFERVAAARQRRSAAAQTLHKARLDAAAELEDGLAQLDSARVSVDAARARVSAGTEAARIETIRYDTGAGTIEDLLRAEARAAGAEAALAHARAQVLSAAARINSLVEKEVTP
jgi:outer membrane protein TolC